jgi:hypothetical protein
MTRPRGVLGIAIFVLSTWPIPSVAHELDEYLQASRISLARDHVTCEIDLTPGADIAADILAVIDGDGDRRVTPAEAEAYGRAVLRDLSLELDGRRLPLTLAQVELPAIDQMTAGVGTIQIRVVADTRGLAAGRRQLSFRNDHRTSAAVYLVNALVPGDPDIVVTSQVRDRKQHEIRLGYMVRAAGPMQAAWVFVAGIALCTLVGWRSQSVSRSRP